MPLPNNPPGLVGPDLGGLTGGSLAPAFDPVSAPGVFNPGDPGSAVAVPDVAPAIGNPRTFIAAIRKALREDGELRARVVGGWWHRRIPPGVVQPAGLYFVPESSDEGAGGPHFIQTGQFQITVFAPRPTDAREIADMVARKMSDIDLAWSNGRLLQFRASSPSSPNSPTPGYGGADVFGETRVFDYILSGQFDR